MRKFEACLGPSHVASRYYDTRVGLEELPGVLAAPSADDVKVMVTAEAGH